MKNHLLIASRYKVYGWIIFLAFLVMHVIVNIIYPELGKKITIQFFPEPEGLFSLGDSGLTLVGAGIILGLMMICFSKEKKEDEYISYLRLRSWQWSVLVSYSILFIANLLIYGGWFLSFMTYNLLTVLIVFIITFNLSLYKLKRGRLEDEK